MCLIDPKFKIAEKDIICFKVYLKYSDGRIVSPYRRILAPEIGILTCTELGKINSYGNVKLGFHSFSNFSDAITEGRDWEDNYTPLIAECTIPRNSMYYKGYFGGKKSYCSKYIKLNKLIYI